MEETMMNKAMKKMRRLGGLIMNFFIRAENRILVFLEKISMSDHSTYGVPEINV